VPKVKYSPQQFTFDARLVKTPLIDKFAPDLKQLDPVLFNGRLTAPPANLLLTARRQKLFMAPTP
jgi:hypothetical protein